MECVRIELKDLRELPRKYWYLGNNSFFFDGFFNYRYLVLGKSLKRTNGLSVSRDLSAAGARDSDNLWFPRFMTTDHINQFGYWYHTLDE